MKFSQIRFGFPELPSFSPLWCTLNKAVTGKRIATSLTNLLALGVFLCLALGVFVPPILGQSDGNDSEKSLADESMLFLEIPSVYGASKYEQKLSEAPSSVSIVTSDEIRKFGYRTLADLLRGVRGFHTTYDRNYYYVGIRGFGTPGDFNTRILMLVDGHRINDSVYDASFVGTEFPVDMDMIDRVEIIRGSSSSLYGTSAFFGVINIITKRGRDLKGAGISAETASYDTYKGRASYGDRFSNGLEAVFSASLSDSSGQDLFFKEFSDINGGFTEDADYLRYRNFFGKLSFQDLAFHAYHVSSKKGVPTGAYGTVFSDPGTYTIDYQTQVGFDYGHHWRNGIELNAKLAYNRTGYYGEYVYDYAEEPEDSPYLVANKDDMIGERWSTELQISKQVMPKHKLVVGTEFRHNFRLQQWNYDEDVYLDDRRNSKIWGTFVQDEFSIFPKFTVNAGVRFDYYGFEKSETNLSPRIGLIYKPDDQTSLKLLYGEAFRAPNAYELYYHDGWWTSKPALELEPETIRTAEIVLERYLGRSFLASAAYFHSTVDNLIKLTTDPDDGLLVMENEDKVRTQGIEMGLDGKLDNGVTARIDYSFQKSQNRNSRQRLVNSPEHLAKLSVSLPVVKRALFAGVEGIYTGNRITNSLQNTGSYFIANLTFFSQSLKYGWDISASVYNLFDKKYGDPGSEEHIQDLIMRDGRSFRIKLGYNFGAR